MYRLQGFDSKLCAEIDAEKDVHRDIFHRLQEAEYDIIKFGIIKPKVCGFALVVMKHRKSLCKLL